MKAYRDQIDRSIIMGKYNKQAWSVLLVFFLLWSLLHYCHYSALYKGITFFSNYSNSFQFQDTEIRNVVHDGPNMVEVEQIDSLDMVNNKTCVYSCSGRYIYVHDLPSRFNDDILKNCSNLNKWIDMCESLMNMGLGPEAGNSNGVLLNNGWFLTNQFVLELIFRSRMKDYECLTDNSSMASAIYVPFYAGLEVGRHLWGFNTSVRDQAGLDLVKWLAEKPEWKTMFGRDHFFVSGRITWDLRRSSNDDSDWGSNFLSLPEAKNMTMLVIESSPWSDTDFAIPYPTYFHPSSDIDVFGWQEKVRTQERKYLFSFVGASRPNDQESIRGEIVDQCLESGTKCKFLECNSENCHDPADVMIMFQNSIFCLQPSGDSATRRSTFDSILAGCIPVFFNPGSAYKQYIWHLPSNYTKYSVFIPENDFKDGEANIEKILVGMKEEQVLAMREEVIRLIPRVIYADPRSKLERIEDAFDIAVKGVLERVENVWREMNEGKDWGEDNSWK